MRTSWTKATAAAAFFAFVLLSAACGGSSAPQTDEERVVALGQQTYRRVCITCHQADGRGIAGVYPPLHRTEWTLGDRGRLIRLVLHGMEGPVEVKGATYDQRMQPLGYLSNEKIAAVLTFVRQNFENDASAVMPAEVAAVRQQSKRQQPWDAATLWTQTGIPAAPSARRPDSPN